MTTACQTTHFGFGQLPLVRELPLHLGGERRVEELLCAEQPLADLAPAGRSATAGVRPRRAARTSRDDAGGFVASLSGPADNPVAPFGPADNPAAPPGPANALLAAPWGDVDELVDIASAGLAAASRALAQLGHGDLARQAAGLSSRLEMAERQRRAPRRAPRGASGS